MGWCKGEITTFKNENVNRCNEDLNGEEHKYIKYKSKTKVNREENLNMYDHLVCILKIA